MQKFECFSSSVLMSAFWCVYRRWISDAEDWPTFVVLKWEYFLRYGSNVIQNASFCAVAVLQLPDSWRVYDKFSNKHPSVYENYGKVTLYSLWRLLCSSSGYETVSRLVMEMLLKVLNSNYSLWVYYGGGSDWQVSLRLCDLSQDAVGWGLLRYRLLLSQQELSQRPLTPRRSTAVWIWRGYAALSNLMNLCR